MQSKKFTNYSINKLKLLLLYIKQYPNTIFELKITINLLNLEILKIIYDFLKLIQIKYIKITMNHTRITIPDHLQIPDQEALLIDDLLETNKFNIISKNTSFIKYQTLVSILKNKNE